MKTTGALALLFLLASLFVTSCSQDDGNYDYLPDDQVSEIKIKVDSLLTPNVYQYSRILPGDTIDIHLKVDYAYADRLQYRWFTLKTNYNQYRAEQVGNDMVYPPADTIYFEKDINWVCTLDPGTYFLYVQAKDPTSGLVEYMQVAGSYIVVESSGVQGGLYMLTERDGATDIEIYTDPLMLIYGGPECFYKYYSSTHNGELLPGKPKFIKGSTSGKASKDSYLVCTSENIYRLNTDGLVQVNTWESMFYTVPDKFSPQGSFFANNCEALLNEGKMHVLYANQPNDIKFSEPIAGDYEAYPFLMRATLTTWRPVEGAIASCQVLYDKKHRAFRPYFTQATQLSWFKSTVGDAYVDANNVPGDIKAIFQGGSYQTYVVTVIDGVYYLYRYQFYNVIDNGDLSADGARSIIDLSGCEDLQNATLFAANTAGGAFYYATPKGVFSFSPTTGQTTSNVVYSCEAGEEITCVYMGGSVGGGWPTSNVILWIGIWNEGAKDGKLFQSEMDVDNGVIRSQWGPMFGAPDNPTITTGWGKIIDMTCLDAE
ncbi:MAG: hypothetical protein K6C10_09405 [Prevotella sp.]|nr:hypothetical protein [Prevotella sp.]